MFRRGMGAALGLVGMLGVMGYGHGVAAQAAGLQIGGQESNFGAQTLRPGFLPDPVNVNVVSGGNLDARTLNLGPGCMGFVTRRPDYIVRMTGNSRSLRMYVTAPGDTTLLVNTGRGQWVCNDDSYGGTNPTVNLPNAGAGQYDVWVGSYQAGANIRGQLHITELDNHP